MLPTVDIKGNISVHTRTGVKIPVLSQDENGAIIDLAGKQWFFEMPGVRKALAANPSNPTGLMVVVTAAEASKLPKGSDVPFVVTDEDGGAVWEGVIRRRGW